MRIDSRRRIVRPLLVAILVSVAAIRLGAQTVDPADVLFDDTFLHDINLVINSRDWRTLQEHFLEDAYYPADLRTQNLVVRNVGIRSRGTGSRSSTKPGLRIDFDRYATEQKFLGLKSMVLRNQTQDASNLHEILSMLLFRRMGVPAPREAFVRLFVNNQFVGAYSIVESVDQGFLTKTFGEHSGNLYDYDYPATDLPYRFEYRGPDPASYVPRPFKPETNEYDPHAEIFERLAWTIDQTNNAVFRTAVAEFLDVTAFIRYVAVEKWLADQDGIVGDYGMNNFYFYRSDIHPGLTPIAWDKSEAFFGGPGTSIWHNIDTPPPLRNRLFDRLIAYADLRTLYLDTLAECSRVAAEVPVTALPGDTRGWFELEMERLAALIHDAVFADTTKPFSNAQFEEGLAAARAFVHARPSAVNLEVAQARIP